MSEETYSITTEKIVFRLWRIALVFSRDRVKPLNLVLKHKTYFTWIKKEPIIYYYKGAP